MTIKAKTMAAEISNVPQLGAIIRQTRKAQGLTQEDLAAICGTGTRFIWELESGKETCQLGKALTVLAMLGLKLKLDGAEIWTNTEEAPDGQSS